MAETKNKKLAIGPQLGALSSLMNANSLYEKIKKELSLSQDQEMLIVSECLKAELALVWLNVSKRTRHIADEYYDALLFDIFSELEIDTSEMPGLYEYISPGKSAWVNDITSYYLTGVMDDSAKEWVYSKFWWDESNPDENILIKLVLKLHYRIFNVLGVYQWEDKKIGIMQKLHTLLSSHFIATQNQIWSTIEFQLKNPPKD
ncbi:MAG TPA: hypothetical protein VMR08_00405 [Patescibacteria group bacterium]|nr:hypothetical protein [Patescibacteria group bacterium]